MTVESFTSWLSGRMTPGRPRRSGRRRLICHIPDTTGYSRQQLTRLVGWAVRGETLAKRYRAPQKGFARKFTAGDVALLAELDALHGTLSGPATKCLLQRAVRLFGDQRYERLAGILVAHLYSLRRARGYAVRRRHWTKIKGQSVAIGVRRAPTPEGRPGFIRIDSVHQGDQDGVKGLYHLNAIDCITQFEIVASCERLKAARQPRGCKPPYDGIADLWWDSAEELMAVLQTPEGQLH